MIATPSNPIPAAAEAPVSKSPVVAEMVRVAVSSTNASQSAIIEHVNWKVAAGDYWIVAGLPGTGKSDLLAVAAGLQRPAAGDVYLFGQNLAALSESEQLSVRLRLGVVFELGGRLFSGMTLGENIALPLRYHRSWNQAQIAETVQSLLELVDLKPLGDRYPNEVSRGWRQRAGLARALVLRPEVLFLEDPLVGLEPRQTRWWLTFLDHLAQGHPFFHQRSVTLVLATHNLATWIGRGRQFALLENRGWHVVGSEHDLSRHPSAALRDLLTQEPAA